MNKVEELRVFTLVDYFSDEADSDPKWSRIGSAIINVDKSISIFLHTYPSNVQELRIRRDDLPTLGSIVGSSGNLLTTSAFFYSAK